MSEAETCWFCERQAGDPTSARIVTLYAEAHRAPPRDGHEIRSDGVTAKLTVRVPRCLSCQRYHTRQRIEMIVAPFVGLAVGIAIDLAPPVGRRLAALGGTGQKLAMAGIVLLAIVLALLVGYALVYRKTRKPTEAEHSYPPLLRLQESGWSRSHPR